MSIGDTITVEGLRGYRRWWQLWKPKSWVLPPQRMTVTAEATVAIDDEPYNALARARAAGLAASMKTAVSSQ